MKWFLSLDPITLHEQLDWMAESARRAKVQSGRECGQSPPHSPASAWTNLLHDPASTDINRTKKGHTFIEVCYGDISCMLYLEKLYKHRRGKGVKSLWWKKQHKVWKKSIKYKSKSLLIKLGVTNYVCMCFFLGPCLSQVLSWNRNKITCWHSEPESCWTPHKAKSPLTHAVVLLNLHRVKSS